MKQIHSIEAQWTSMNINEHQWHESVITCLSAWSVSHCQVWSTFVDGLFWIDSFIYFFFSYHDDKGREALPTVWPCLAKRNQTSRNDCTNLLQECECARSRSRSVFWWVHFLLSIEIDLLSLLPHPFMLFCRLIAGLKLLNATHVEALLSISLLVFRRRCLV